jgi:RNA polymerase sigma-70 factor (ECF subfamily)
MRRTDGGAATVLETARHRASRPEEPRSWQREFEEVALVHRERLYRLALGLCRNRLDAEDLVQETLLRAFRCFDQFTPGTHCLAWLATILRNIFLNQVTRQGTVVLVEDEDALERAAANSGTGPTAPTPEEEFLRRTISDKRLAQAVDRLPQRFREVLLLAATEGLSNREIAQRCELPIGTVMSRTFRARRLLRKSLTFWAGSPRSNGSRHRIRNGAAAGTPVRESGRGARG